MTPHARDFRSRMRESAPHYPAVAADDKTLGQRLAVGSCGGPSAPAPLAAAPALPLHTPSSSGAREQEPGLSVVERATFMRKVDKGDAMGPGACWEWLGRLDFYGYGQVWSRGRHVGAHRVAYESMVGQIPAGLVIDHLCRNRACVNPAHLEPVTMLVNTMRGEWPAASRAGLTSCQHGHSFGPKIHRKRSGVRRRCPECARRSDAVRYARLMADPVRHERRKVMQRQAQNARRAMGEKS